MRSLEDWDRWRNNNPIQRPGASPRAAGLAALLQMACAPSTLPQPYTYLKLEFRRTDFSHSALFRALGARVLRQAGATFNPIHALRMQLLGVSAAK
jgi:hypothetical protein